MIHYLFVRRTDVEPGTSLKKLTSFAPSHSLHSRKHTMKSAIYRLAHLLAFFWLVLSSGATGAVSAGDIVGRIQPWPQDARYWQYQGQPVLLLGGTVVVSAAVSLPATAACWPSRNPCR